MSLTIPVAHDFICPWCWVGFLQAEKLTNEFGVTFEWLGYELFPIELEWPDYPATAPIPNKPATPSRLDFLLKAEGMEMPKASRPRKMRTYFAHQAVEYAKTIGRADDMIRSLYQAYWLRGEEINNIEVLVKLAAGIVTDVSDFREAVETKRFANKVVGFDDDAYANGVFNVPTFFIGTERYAEQPTSTLKEALIKELAAIQPTSTYGDLTFPAPPIDRPYTYINMVTTIDGKILSGDRSEDVLDLGSKVDHQIMRKIEGSADAVLIGAQTLRSCSKNWIPSAKIRIVVTQSGNLPWDHGFFQGGEAYVIAPFSTNLSLPEGIHAIHCGDEMVDFSSLFHQLRNDLDIKRIAVLGGSEINGQLLELDLVDELFLTLAPKVKLGSDTPTYACGKALPKESLQQYNLVEHQAIGNEIFVRYRRTLESSK